MKHKFVEELTVIEILIQRLKEGGFDGLANGPIECGCFLDDLAPCGSIYTGCAAGHAVKYGDDILCMAVMIPSGEE